MNNIASTVESSIADAERYLTSTTSTNEDLPPLPPSQERSLPLHLTDQTGEGEAHSEFDDSLDIQPLQPSSANLQPVPPTPPSPTQSEDSLVQKANTEDEGEVYFARYVLSHLTLAHDPRPPNPLFRSLPPHVRSDINHKNPTAASWEVTFGEDANPPKPKPKLKTKQERVKVQKQNQAAKSKQVKHAKSSPPVVPTPVSVQLSRPARESLESVLAEEVSNSAARSEA